jgi:type IV pilus assembly protein PilQ
MRQAMRKFFQGLLLLTLCYAAFDCYATTSQLRDIKVTLLGDGQVKIDFAFLGNVGVPKSFSTEVPPRVIVDFSNVRSSMSQPKQTIGLDALRAFEVFQAGNRTRVVFDLTQLVSYEFKKGSGHLYLYLMEKAPEIVSTENQRFAEKNVDGGASHQITGIDFRRDQDQGGRVIVNLSDANMGINVVRQGDEIVTSFVGTSVANRNQRRLDVTDFGTPIQFVRTRQRGGNSEVAVTATGKYKFLTYQVNNQFVIDVSPEEDSAASHEEIRYTGEKLSLNFQDIAVRAVLQLLAEFTGINIVASNSVTGNITLRLNDVPWDEALAIILKTQGLAKRDVGNILMIAPKEEVLAREKEDLEAKKAVNALEPLRIELVQLNYATAEEAANLLKSNSVSLLSPRGSVSVDERTNTLLVQDTISQLTDMRKLLTELDVPVRQVLIEARIVNVDSNFEKDLGIRWGYTNPNRTSGTLEGANTINNNALENHADGSNKSPLIDVPFEQRLNVNLPAAVDNAGRFGLALAKLGNDFLLDLEISALESEGIGEVISTPRVVTANQHEAYIEKGEEIPYEEASSSGATAVQFKKAVLGLRVTPQITPDNKIIMTLAINQDTRGENTTAGPAINTRQLQTKVLVDNGQTIVLGGIYEETDRHQTQRIPFLGSLPVVGNLFKNSEAIHSRIELLIFITPKIVEQVPLG